MWGERLPREEGNAHHLPAHVPQHPVLHHSVSGHSHRVAEEMRGPIHLDDELAFRDRDIHHQAAHSVLVLVIHSELGEDG